MFDLIESTLSPIGRESLLIRQAASKGSRLMTGNLSVNAAAMLYFVANKNPVVKALMVGIVIGYAMRGEDNAELSE